ncbi:AIPR protein [Flavobacterium psychrophilum]|nr:AIPR protein [Flavobacterium psychrophilum]AOE52171.1 AIPR protein [Flavobacterium psychrophilum]
MTKYHILLNILDTIVTQANGKFPKKYPPKKNASDEELNQARSRAFIHLFLMVKFGILDFSERERFLTDGSFDGGIDGYYINSENKTIYFIQSKFRTNIKNFETKEILLEEILLMDLNRILNGETTDEDGNEYNGKIKQLQREIGNTENIARYSYQVIILANLNDVKQSDLRKLTDGFSSTVFNFEKCYTDLIFPVISGTFFQASDLSINIDLSNKNAGSKISYTVQTKKGECEITVLFVPTIELGKIMYKYKNSILKYNPRSYLGHEGKKVNTAIKETIIEKDTNEFALFNNGVTMLSDETYINERIGQKNKAQLIVKNPQIINGGQTSYTLSRIYEENINNDVEAVFQNKEVLIKIITLLDKNDDTNKIELINEISNATNQQTPVINADKFSNDSMHVNIQKILFEKFGVLYERKRGEFADGIYNGYIQEKLIIERNLFFRMFYAANGFITTGKQKRLFVNQKLDFNQINEDNKLENAYYGFVVFKKLFPTKNTNQVLGIIDYAKVRAMTLLYKPEDTADFENSVDKNLHKLIGPWQTFLDTYKNKFENQRIKKNSKTGEIRIYQSYDYGKWFDSEDFDSHLIEFYRI